MYALHYACSKLHSDNVILMLLKLYPEAISIKTRSCGSYPLHLALKKQLLSETIVLHLIHTYPQAVQEPTSNGDYALHLACLNKDLSNNNNTKQQKQFPYFLMNDKVVTVTRPYNNVIQTLMKLYPQAIAIQRHHDGHFPLHLALTNHLVSNTVLVQLISKDQQALTQITKTGEFALHCACTNKNISDNILMLLINIKPIAVKKILGGKKKEKSKIGCIISNNQ
jgi:ankyrin repeat protein